MMNQSPGKAVGVGRRCSASEKIVAGNRKTGTLVSCGSWEKQFGTGAVFRHYGPLPAISKTSFAALWALNSRWQSIWARAI